MADNDWKKEIDWKDVRIYHAKELLASGKFRKWNKKNYHCIAITKIIVPTSHEVCCEMAFDITQNFSNDYWCEKVKSLDWIAVAEGPHRSTTFGDVVMVNDVPYRCETTGWVKLTRRCAMDKKLTDDERCCPYCGSDDIQLQDGCKTEQDSRDALEAGAKRIVVKLACKKCYGFWDNTYVKGGD